MTASTLTPTLSRTREREQIDGARSSAVVIRRGRAVRTATDWLADEVPVALSFNGISHAVMLTTPSDLEDFALGFGLSEGLLKDRTELLGAEESRAGDGITLDLEVTAACEMRLKDRRRNMAGRTGCGLCGTEKLEQVRLPLPTFDTGITIGAQAIARGLREMKAAQKVQHLTGAVHAAAWCDADGHAQIVREDVGRHNALDKLIGAMVRARVDAKTGFICVTSRASFEMVQKTAMAGVTTLVAVSAPTALARDTAAECGLCLVGFARDDDFVLYVHPERVTNL